jgi:uncharacterized cupin superfamily protein
MRFSLLSIFLLAVVVACGPNTEDTVLPVSADPMPSKIVRAGDAESVENPFHPVKMMLSSQENVGKVTIYEFEVPAQSAGSPPHTHTLEDEYFFILEGRLDIMNGDRLDVLREGDFASLSRGDTHMFWNSSDAPVRLLMMTTGGSFEAFIGAVAPRLADAKPANSMEAGAVVGQLASEHGITISMDRMPAQAATYYQP